MFTPAAPPKRAGDYTRFAVKRASVLPPATGGIVCIPFTDDWGPFKEPVLLNSFAEYLAVFGSPLDITAPTDGFVAVYNAFKGEGPNIAPGAGAVLAYRHGGAAAAKASRSLDAGATTPAITFTAKYEGVRGNNIKVETVANAANPTTQIDLNVYDGVTKVESYEGYGATDVQTLADDVTARSSWLTASGATNGTLLDVVAAQALTGGNSGNALLASDWTAATTGTIAVLEPQQFGIFAPANLTDSSVITALNAWAISKNQAEKAKRFFLVEGGAAGETFSAAVTRSSGANDENIVNFGVGTYHDSDLDIDLSTAQLAPRLAGVMAARGGRASISFAYLEDLTIKVGPSETDITSALDNGVVVVALGTGGVRFEKGVTTYTTKTNADKPFDTYKVIKYVATMQAFERDGKEANENGQVLGVLPVNNDTREEIVSREQKRLDEYIARKEVQPGAKVMISSAPAPTDDDDFIAIDWTGKFSRSLEQIRRSVFFS